MLSDQVKYGEVSLSATIAATFSEKILTNRRELSVMLAERPIT